MPRTARDFSPIDEVEQKNISYGFGIPGGPRSPLAFGETVVSVTFKMNVISGIDPLPSSRLIGAPVIQPGGLVVTQKVGALLPSVLYEIMAIATTSSQQILDPYSRLKCNPSTATDIIPMNFVVPAISGSTQIGEILTATTGTWTHSPASYIYQWKSNGANATGAGSTTANYTVATGDIGNTLTVSVTATNAAGSSLPAISTATSPIGSANPLLQLVLDMSTTFPIAA